MPSEAGRESPPAGEASPPAPDAAGEATLELFSENAAYTEFLWRSLLALSARPCAGRVLEIGCGIGNLTSLILRSEAVTYLHALDMEPAYVERIRRSILDDRLETSVGRAEDFCPERFRSAEAGFDRIVASNVIEHIEDDLGVLSNFRRMLRPEGMALVLVPAHPSLFSTLDRSLSHFRRYTRAGLEASARAASLKVLALRHFNPLGALGWLLNGKVLRRSILPAGQLALYSRFALPISALLDRWNPFPVGVSLLAVLVRA